MKGWKTWSAAFGLFASGMGMIYFGIKEPSSKEIMVGMGIQCILMGGGLIGIGHKVEKSGY